MSNRDSMGFGDLIPQDVVDIFAQEKHGKRGRKKRSRSLGQALGWLKGKKRKNLDASLGLGPALDLALDGHPAGHKGGPKSGRHTHSQGNSHAVPKRDDDDKTPAPPLRQENVFIEASRPKYLENLHSEALEGLKMMQQEETNNGVEFPDNESTISTLTVHTDGFMSDSTINDTTSVRSVQSSVSTRSSRSGLTRQESTFRPLNSGKKSEKTKTRRRHRKTVGGIPQHVKRELGLDRVGWSLTQRFDEEQLYNGETDDSSTTDGPQQRGASASLTKDQLKQLGDHVGHGDDLALLHRLGPDLSGGQSPLTLAFPWMTTANSLQQEPPSPVMSMSPQAAYMSKIIPNAVLPPSIEVVEISRGRSRNSVRTVSKSSLLLSSPSPSRASSRTTSSTITSASRYNPINVSDSSCWSNSESSDTLVSDSSTISRSSTPRRRRSQDGDASAKEDKISVHSSISKASKCTSNGNLIKGEGVKKEGPFVRSLSVMKSKKAPPPPNRSYSLHNKMKRRSRDLADVRVNAKESSPYNFSASGEENEKNTLGYSPVSTSTIDSPGYNADTSSLDESTGSASFSPIRSQAHKAEGTVSKDASQEKQKLLQENTLSKIISPSSGYSSQDGASSQVSKQPHKRGILAKLQRFFPGSTHAASTASRLPLPEDLKPHTSDDMVNISPSVRALRELFNIPPPPKVHAPPPPPPEVWAHSKRSIELLLGPPAPDNLYAIIKKNPKDRRQQRQSPSASTESSVIERKHKNPAVTVESVNVLETKKVQESGLVSAESHKENRLAEQNVDVKGNSKVTEQDEKVRVSDIINVMLVRAIEKREGRLEAVREEDEVKKTSTQTSEVKTCMDTLPAMSLARILPSPSPPLVHHPPQQTMVASVTSVVISPESSWPPPPPPLAGLNGPDVIDFPLPPPPMFGEVGLVIPVQVPPERSINNGDPSCTTTPVISVVKTECVRVNTEIEPQKSSPSQGTGPPPLSIPPPPPYMAPPPPVNAVSPLTTKDVTAPPPPPKEVTPPPPPPKEATPPPPPKEATPPPPPPPKEATPPPPPKEATPPPPPPPKEATPPPPPPKEATPPPPPPKEATPPPPPKEATPPPPPPPPKEAATPPPPPKEATPPPPPKDLSPVRPKESSPTLVKDVSIAVVSLSPVIELSPPLVIKVSPQPPTEVSTLSTEEIYFPSTQENACQSSEEVVSKLTPPQSIPPPPPLPSQPKSKQEMDLPQESIPFKSETSSVSSDINLTPPQSIPPQPPVQLPQVVPQNTDGPATQELPPSPPSEVSIQPALENSLCLEKAQEPAPPVNIPLPVQDLASINLSSPTSTENQVPDQTSDPVVQEEPTPILTPSPNSIAENQKQPEAEVTMRKQQPSNPVPTSSASGEAPQKPIRRSMIIISPALPPPASPPSIVTAQPALPKSVLVLPVSSSSVVSPPAKSPPAMTASPSMNLQEAIRLRTAARSKAGPQSRLSLNSPTSPVDLRKSPSSTASFIFSKSNKKVVIETKPAPETMATGDTNLEVSPVTKGVKVPPPVAKKPKAKGKGIETGEGTEQTAGQEVLQESIMDAAEKTNATAGTVEGGTPLT